MDSPRAVLFAIALVCFIPSTGLSAQTLQKSDKECMKLVPGDWGPNFGEEWKQHEAMYWGCRLGVQIAAVHEWQNFGSGMIAKIIPMTIDNEQIVIIESTDGSAHCYNFYALRKTQKGWESIWSPPSDPDSMGFCTLACPRIRMRVHGKILTLETPESSDPNEDQTFSCKHVKWNKATYRWNGQTFQPTSGQAHGKTAQIPQ